jgi:aminopeptidase 2
LLGWEFSDRDGHIRQQFKSLLFGAAGTAGDEKIKKASFDMFDKFIKGDRNAIHLNLRSAVFAVNLKFKPHESVCKNMS